MQSSCDDIHMWSVMDVRREYDVVKGRQRFEVGENVTPQHFMSAFGETSVRKGRLMSSGAVAGKWHGRTSG